MGVVAASIKFNKEISFDAMPSQGIALQFINESDILIESLLRIVRAPAASSANSDLNRT
jgi:hypothetical protein